MCAYLEFVASASNREAWPLHDRDRVSRALATFFGPVDVHEVDMGDHVIPLTGESLRGRFLSTSIAPPEGDVRRPALLAHLAEIHRRFEEGGAVPFQLRWRYIWSFMRRRA